MAACDQLPAEQHRGLNGHTDALSDYRMRLGGRIADVEDSLAPPIANASPDRSGCEPSTFGYCVSEYSGCALARCADVREYCPTGYRMTMLQAARSEVIAANTAGQADGAISGVHHAAVTTRESDQRHQVLRQAGAHEARLECE